MTPYSEADDIDMTLEVYYKIGQRSPHIFPLVSIVTNHGENRGLLFSGAEEGVNMAGYLWRGKGTPTVRDRWVFTANSLDLLLELEGHEYFPQDIMPDIL
jgi:hypothetical protein